jgi:filamentous hemagglutinin family protein
MSGIGSIWHYLLGIAISSAWVLSARCATAQITPDRTLPNNSSVTINGSTFNITGGTQAGQNLFHSFQQFSVPTGGTASFNNGLDVQNIISRVTGGSVSNIDGIIRANGTANVFFLNPSGIVFGRNARLNIGGSFIGTSASSINFTDGTQFSTTTPQGSPLLTVTAPVGLNMGNHPGKIQVIGSGHDIVYEDIKKDPRPRVSSNVPGLEVETGKTFALVGGDVSIVGGVIKSPGGRIEIASVGSNGIVSLVPEQQAWRLGYQGLVSFGDIQFSGKPFVSATGVGGGSIVITGKQIAFTEQSILLADTLGDRNGGEISIAGDSIRVNESDISNNTFSSGNAGQITLSANDSILLENNGGAGNHTEGLGKAGEITLTAKSVFIRDRSGLGNNTYSNAQGDAGQINVNADFLLIEKQSGFGNSSYSIGNGGQTNIKVNGSFILRNYSGIGSQTYQSGNGGQINITANSLLIEDHASINSESVADSKGRAGDINTNVGSLVVRNSAGINASTEGMGNAGSLNVRANSLVLENYGGLEVKSTSLGNAGSLNIWADSIRLLNSGIDANTSGKGNAGSLNVHAKNLVLDYSGLQVNNTGLGNVGNLNIWADSIRLLSSGIDANTSNGDNAGALNIQAKNLALDHSEVAVNNTGLGNAGSLNIWADSIRLLSSGINARTSSGNGGYLTLNVGKLLLMQRNSQISSTAGTQQAPGNGGDITINVPSGFLVAIKNENSDITANAFNGSGGKVQINAQGIYNFNQRSLENLETLLGTKDQSKLDPQNVITNDITAFSLTSPTLSGQVKIITPDIDPSRGLISLPTVTEDTSKLVASSCAAFNEAHGGSNFVMTGRGGLPLSPKDPLTSDVLWTDTRLPVVTAQQQQPKTHTTRLKPKPIAIIPATDWVLNDKGEITLISSVSNATAVNTPMSCPVR